MAILSISKTYVNGDSLFEVDIDNIRSAAITFVNTTKINDDNIQNGGITASDKMKPNDIVGTKLKTSSITSSKITLSIRFGVVGTIQMFHTFAGTVNVPRGWMICNGDQVTEANYEAIHGGGAWLADGIASGALGSANLHLPAFNDKYPTGAATTSQTGTTAITAVGNGNHLVSWAHTHNIGQHIHKVYNYVDSVILAHTYNSSGGNAGVLTTPLTTHNGIVATFSTNTKQDFDAYTQVSSTVSTDSSGSGTEDHQPESIEALFIMKVI